MTGAHTTVLVAGLCLFVGCARSESALPGAAAIVEAFQSERPLSGEVTGNVAVLYVEQSFQQLRRGGNLWAKVGPYIFLFSAEAQRLFDAYPGLAGIRVETRVAMRPSRAPCSCETNCPICNGDARSTSQGLPGGTGRIA